MKKTIVIILSLFLVITFYGCAEKKEILVDYGASQLYSKEEIDDAVKIIKRKSKFYDMRKISYTSDSISSEQLEICNIKSYKSFDQAITFECEFYIEGEGIINNYWTLARKDNGKWVSIFSPF